jgi:rare lipoprotein A
MSRVIIRWVTAAALLCITACSSSPAPPAATNPNAGRYSISQDRAPNLDVDLSAIPEVIPEPLIRSRTGNRSPYTVLGKTYNVLPTEEGYNEVGVASWYGEKFHGHKTSNGETFDMYRVSAAHKSLPIPSFMRVTNLDNNRSIVVRVNDRGPFHGDRIVDLSYAAAMKLDYAERGTARVLLESIVASGYQQDGPVASRQVSNSVTLSLNNQSENYLQVGAFSELSAARELSNRLRSMTDRPVFIRSVESQGKGVLYRVRVGPVNDPNEIQQITQSVVAANLGSPYTITE